MLLLDLIPRGPMKHLFSYICRSHQDKGWTFRKDIEWNLKFRKISKTVASNISVYDCLIYYVFQTYTLDHWSKAYSQMLPFCKNLYQVDGHASSITQHTDEELPSVKKMNVSVDVYDMSF